MLAVAALMLLLPEPAAAADGESEADGSPVFAALLTFFILVGSWLCLCRRRQARPEVVDQGTQTDEPPVSQAVEPPSLPRECVFVAPRYGQKFHYSRTCRGLNSGLEVRRLERCRLCG